MDFALCVFKCLSKMTGSENYVDDCQVYLAEEQPQLILRKEFQKKNNVFDKKLYEEFKKYLLKLNIRNNLT